jgi:hypothetical protein
MSFSLPPIVKQAERLLVEIEKAVRSFPRYEKYGCGSDLRAQARKVTVLTHRAWRQQRDRLVLIGRLIHEIDELKILLQLGVRLRAFASFRQFEMLARLASDIGKQAGGWKRQHPTTQNAQAGSAPAQRGQILSTPAASLYEAHA